MKKVEIHNAMLIDNSKPKGQCEPVNELIKRGYRVNLIGRNSKGVEVYFDDKECECCGITLDIHGDVVKKETS